MKLFYFILIAIVFSPVFAISHLDAGIDKEAGSYIVDFGYAPVNLQAGEKSIFNFILTNKNDSGYANADRLWIRISNEEEVVLSTNLYLEGSISSLSYIFPEGGSYDIDLKFYNGMELLADTAFSVDVGSVSEKTGKSSLNLALLAAAFILLLYIVWKERKLLLKFKKD
ncbi:hypothetical protein J4212_03945 [Candidatus Woesearchaeota archaeon]|nr:hypothetical protein [Candidatus Woesearchaeota archaeon]